MVSTKQSALAVALTIGWIAVGAPTQAHQQWLMPNSFTEAGETAWVSFDHTFGDQRFQAGSAPGLYYQWWVVGPDQKKRTVPFLFAGKTKTVGEVELTEPGTYRLEGEEPNMVWTQLEVDGSNVWQPGPRGQFEGQEIVESKIYFAKALAYVALEPAGATAPAASGDPLEIVFRQHPNRLEAGRPLEITLLSFGKPVAGQTVQLFSDHSTGHDPTLTCSTDTQGACKVLPEAAGRYLLTAQLQGPTPDDPTTDGFSYRVSVALEVGPRPSPEKPGGG